MLEVSALSVAYGQHRALEDVSLSVGRGEIVVILGANGAGKSTLLRAISGICEGRVTGEVTLGGHALTGLPPDRIVEEGVALVPEGRGIFSELTVRENLTLGAYPARAREDEAAGLDQLLALFPKLAERAGQIVRTMSGGEQQMVAIGRAMMSNPAILTLDEPSLGLSPLLSRELFANLRRVRDLGLGMLLVEQNARASLAIADRGYLLENGRIVHEAPAAALASDPAVQAAYLGAAARAAPSAPPALSLHEAGDGRAGASSPAASVGRSGPPAPEAAAADPAPASWIELRPRPVRTVSTDALLGRSVAELVERAAHRAHEAASGGARPEPPDPATNGDRLAQVLREIEAAAQAARRRRE